MISHTLLPGFALWGRNLDAWLSGNAPLGIQGLPGSGLSTLAHHTAASRNCPLLDDADQRSMHEVHSWLGSNPRGLLALHHVPDGPDWQETLSRCVWLRIPSLEEDPASLPNLAQALADQEGILDPLPPALLRLPCPGQLRGLHHRILRWKWLGQLPEAPETHDALPLEQDTLAENLHVLERLLLHRALRRSYGNRSEAAQRLGVSRRQLYLLIERHGDPLRDEPAKVPGPKRLLKRQ